jgi:drug/metabolite transporter (DMT)-like permease
MALITHGPKFISAAEVSLIMLLETVLGPLWVWLVLAEQPGQQTFMGGGLVITAIVVNSWLGFRASDR